MSYILDALKKSDQERQQNNGPGLQTIQRTHLTHQRPKSKIMIVILLLCCCMLIVGVFFFQKSDMLSTIISGFQSKADEQLASRIQHPKTTLATQDDDIETTKKPAINTTSQPLILVRFWDLPDPIQKQIPAMTFSFHVYSDNPQRRTIIINKRRVKEGEGIFEGLLLEEITEQGVILNWKKQYRFSINVVESW